MHIRGNESHTNIVHIRGNESHTNIVKLIHFDKYIKLIKTLNINKTCQDTNTPALIIKINDNLFGHYTFKNSNYYLEKGHVLCTLKHTDVATVQNKKIKK